MRTCWQCGFESAGDDDPCTLCGALVDPSPETEDDIDTFVLSPNADTPASKTITSRIFPGDVIANRYLIGHLLGKGGMGSVFQAIDQQTDTAVAVKIHHLGDLTDPAAEQRFGREVEVLERIRHPAVPLILNSGRVGENLFLVSELVEGVDLHAKLENGKRWSVEDTASLGADIAAALGVAHDQGIVHRDVKPKNIMINTSGKVYLVDFGLARGVNIDLKTLTKTGMMVGTPAYMSPEQCAGKDVDGRSDLYSLGIVMYELLTARTPFEADSPLAMAMLHTSGSPARPSSLDQQIPRWIDRIILKCLEKAPDRRYPSAQALVKELLECKTGSRLEKKDLGNGWRILLGHPEWHLVVWPPAEQKEWRTGMALHFDDQSYKLGMIVPLRSGWEYRFTIWPPREIFRKQVILEEAINAESEKRSSSLSARLKKIIKGKT